TCDTLSLHDALPICRLAPGGELRVVANQHLGYQRPLGKLFPRVDTVARNAKFVIFRCIKGSP
uniref:methyltransferase n=1 Tax=Alloalcanivorax venustensis TaxID=172371 RepID=UPI0035A2C221